MCVSKLAEVLEKVLKAELIRTGWFLERTHDLMVLARLLEARGSDFVAVVKPLAQSLAGVYFTTRYPGFDLDDANWPDLRSKLDAVTKLFKSVKERVAAGGS
jgi:HEPN domain-containing protein